MHISYSLRAACLSKCPGTAFWFHVHSESLQFSELLDDVDGVLVPGGFGDRGIEGKIEATRYARETKKPFLGICLGMQLGNDRICT